MTTRCTSLHLLYIYQSWYIQQLGCNLDYNPIIMRITSDSCSLKTLTSLPWLKRSNFKLFVSLLQLKKTGTYLLQLMRCSLKICTSMLQLKRCTLTMWPYLLQKLKYFSQCRIQLIRCTWIAVHLQYICWVNATVSSKTYICWDVFDPKYISQSRTTIRCELYIW